MSKYLHKKGRTAPEITTNNFENLTHSYFFNTNFTQPPTTNLDRLVYFWIFKLKIKRMKKTLTLFVFAMFSFGIWAQCPLTTAVDFTGTDTHGTSHTLSDYLAQGKYVLIDFFFTN